MDGDRDEGCGVRIVRIADIVFALSSARPRQPVRLEAAYQDFAGSGEPEVTLHARYDGLPEIALRDEDRVFDSEAVWSLYRAGAQYLLALRSPPSNPVPYRVAVFDAGFQRGEVFNAAPQPGGDAGAPLPNPLEYPLSEVLMVCLLAQGRGLMVHACGIDDGGRGYLFAGKSTHGKSTMAGLWQDRATVLNDDRIVLRQRAGRFWMYGTPWHGDYGGVSPHGVPLERVFYLRQTRTNRLEGRAGAAASAMLLARCFPPLWDAEGMAFTLGFCSRLVEAVPCYELGFVPDGSVVDLVRGMT